MNDRSHFTNLENTSAKQIMVQFLYRKKHTNCDRLLVFAHLQCKYNNYKNTRILESFKLIIIMVIAAISLYEITQNEGVRVNSSFSFPLGIFYNDVCIDRKALKSNYTK